MRERLLVTGAAGRIGTHLVPLLRAHFALRLRDIQPMTPEGDDEREPAMLAMGCSPKVWAQWVIKSVRSGVFFAIFFAVSDNPKRHWDISNAQQWLGDEPEDNAADFVGEGA